MEQILTSEVSFLIESRLHVNASRSKREDTKVFLRSAANCQLEQIRNVSCV